MRLDSHWHSPTPKIAKQRILLSSPNKTPTDTIKLYHGRYLMVGARSSFVFYDLDAPDWETPSFGSGVTDATFTFYRGDTNQNAAVSYISAVASTKWPVYTGYGGLISRRRCCIARRTCPLGDRCRDLRRSRMAGSSMDATAIQPQTRSALCSSTSRRAGRMKSPSMCPCVPSSLNVMVSLDLY
ncbi:hypothetical protein CYLTODRAFT_25337 [Cylindrobasidium torrendii FP15055 ss-10]|uniref:Uncharacterized protein n=1 Tax=Cylindrobasidium torrendii FP15055 ss-10 TaxID=1314674 RepID=A0A0D7B899_9AGAR|nr:hypothetical protein CYLTODRAFT_25337 [Cylindrobasidium torrendii FP15055 ss-10]